jgi:hypothetical protein
MAVIFDIGRYLFLPEIITSIAIIKFGPIRRLQFALLRYVRKPCCGNEQHVTNKQEAGYVTGQGATLGDMTSWLNNLAFTRRIRNYTVVNPNELLGSEDSMEQRVEDIHRYYQEDPVHMTLEGYQDLSKKNLCGIQ